MPVYNREIEDIFGQVADLLEIRGENPFRIRAYREAARIVGGMSEPIEKMVKQGRDLTEIKGIGKDLSKKIEEIIETGRLAKLEEVKQELPATLLELLKIPALGPKKVAVLYRKLDIETVEALRTAAEAGKIAALEGFGKKSQDNILQALSRTKKESGPRILWSDAEPFAAAIVAYLQNQPGADGVTVAGSFRRGRETIGDLDILMTCADGYEEPLMDAFVRFADVTRVNAHGRTKSSVILHSGLQVDLRIVDAKSYGAALHYFTGSKSHNISLRRLAQEKGLKINEYGVFQEDTTIAGATEAAVYESLGLAYIEPELRENLGEIESAKTGTLPALVTLNDIRGDLHAHTTRTDGHGSLLEMAEGAQNLGYEYLAITEHSRKVAMAHGLNEKDLRKHMEMIDEANAQVDGITLLKGIEVDILADGSLDLPDSVLKDLDLTICSVHYQQRFGREQQTERIIRAMDNPCCKILGHPTGRLINRREPMDIDLEKIIEAAKDRNVVIELNGHPERLDLPHNYCKMAAERGVMIAVSTDAHSVDNLNHMKNGIIAARRGWLTRENIVNTRGLSDLLKILKRA